MSSRSQASRARAERSRCFERANGSFDAGSYARDTILELSLSLSSDQALAECRRRGLVVTSERELAGCPGSRHWHLRDPDRVGTLELNEWQGRVWVKVHPLREGEWAPDFARELAAMRTAE